MNMMATAKETLSATPIEISGSISIAEQAQRWILNNPERYDELSTYSDPAYRSLQNLISNYLIHEYPSVDHPLLLDVGCGLGFLSKHLADLGYSVTAIDPALPEYGHLLQSERVEYFSQSVEEFSDATAPQSFDLIVCNMVLHCVPNLGAMMEAAGRLLKDGGSLIATIPNPDTYLQSREDINTRDIDMRRPHVFELNFRIHGRSPHQAKVFYFHRPMSHILEAGRSNRLVLTDEFVPEQVGTGRSRDIKLLRFTRTPTQHNG